MQTPPGPRKWEVLPLIAERRRDPLALYERLARDYGDLCYFKVGRLGFCLVNDPELVRIVLQENHKNYPKGPGYDRLRAVVGEGLLTSEGELWKRQRKLIQPAFHHAQLGATFEITRGLVLERIAKWKKESGTLDLSREMSDLSLGVAARSLFGATAASETSAVVAAVANVLKYAEERRTDWLRVIDMLLPIKKDLNLAFRIRRRLPSQRVRDFEAALSRLDALVQGLIDRRRGNPGAPVRDVLGLMMAMQDDATGEKMSDRQLRDEVMTFFLAGHETTAASLTASWYLLSREPALEARLRREIRENLPNGLREMADLEKIPSVEQFFEEALRIFPPLWRISRQADQDTELGGYAIPAGTVMIISPYLLHRHPKLWPNPMKVHPENFSEPARAERHRFAFIPFGAGPRVCVGASMATTVATTTIAMILPEFGLRVDPDYRFGLDLGVTMRLQGRVPARAVTA